MAAVTTKADFPRGLHVDQPAAQLFKSSPAEIYSINVTKNVTGRDAKIKRDSARLRTTYQARPDSKSLFPGLVPLYPSGRRSLSTMFYPSGLGALLSKEADMQPEWQLVNKCTKGPTHWMMFVINTYTDYLLTSQNGQGSMHV